MEGNVKLVLGFAMMAAACQASTTTSVIEQPLEEICNVQAPPPTQWEGVLPPTTDTTTIVILRDENNEEWTAYAADPEQLKIHWVVQLDSKSIESFVVTLPHSGRNSSHGRKPPMSCPPRCGHELEAAYAMAVALRLLPIWAEAEADIDVCVKP
jgi:hypothetical protein